MAAAAPVPTPDLAGIVCATHDGSGPVSPDGPARHDHACCTAAAPGPAAAAPPVAADAAGAAAPASAIIVWRMASALQPTGPPTRSTSARGPPLA